MNSSAALSMSKFVTLLQKQLMSKSATQLTSSNVTLSMSSSATL